MCGVPVLFICVGIVLVTLRVKLMKHSRKKHSLYKWNVISTFLVSSGILPFSIKLIFLMIVLFATLLNQQIDRQEGIAISHLKSTAFRNKSPSN